MEEGLIALPLSAITTLFVAVIGFFLKNAMADLKEEAQQVDDLKTRVIVLEQRDGTINQLQTDVQAMRGDLSWVREKLAAMAARTEIQGG
tara:strand:- start:793 stop:1062 length:270 start_codon:yes stop_codon:yes gene_type:complete